MADVIDFDDLKQDAGDLKKLQDDDLTGLSKLIQRQLDLDSEIENIISSVVRFMKVVDQVDEFRVIGGDPFMNKQLHKVVNKLCLIDKAKKVVVYTNAKIIP